MRLVSLAALIGTGSGHGMLVSPPARNAVDRFLPQFQNGQSPRTPCSWILITMIPFLDNMFTPLLSAAMPWIRRAACAF